MNRFIKLRYLISMLLFVLVACGKSPAPEITFTDLKGQSFHLAQFKDKVVMVNFWATSCTTCVAEMPNMVRLYEKFHARGLKYIAVAMSYDPPNYVINFTQTRKLPFIVTLDVSGQLARAFGDIKLTPTTLVIDRQGNIIKKYVGPIELDALEKLLETQLGG